MAGVLQEGVQR
uniref:Uncharacterized protein n=1 Tax=Arundo donax TaxID=35708 RepID=A0A0A9GTI4_ARUDO